MERLTKHSKQTSHENGICCTHFCGPECLEVGGNCAMNCKWEEAAWSRLAAYEDTGLTPEDCARATEIDDILLDEYYPSGRMRELIKADKDGRVVVLPCKVGDTVWAILDGAKYARECKVDFVNIGSFGTTIVFAVKDGLREQYGVTAAAFGKTVFLTRKEAEKALEAMKDA